MSHKKVTTALFTMKEMELEELFRMKGRELREYGEILPVINRGVNESTQEDKKVISSFLATMHDTNPVKGLLRSASILNQLPSIAPYINFKRYREMDRTSKYDISCFMLFGTHDAIVDTIVILDPMNAINCETIHPRQHACVYMPHAAKEYEHKQFHLFVKHGPKKIYYKGRYRIGNLPKRRASVETWKTLSKAQQFAMAEIIIGREKLGKGPTVRQQIIHEYDIGSRSLYIVPLFCGYFNDRVQGECFHHAMSNPGLVEIRRRATHHPGTY
ncbi:hypothetical protein BXZ70DRAFT_174331 [Cristinia sonorae]|uniref:DUF6697 domain-containing protein n=1 Tax=Cristinia sonorae TaxID=1940300 RepID=A0A8K0UMA6_9AGAR|nr:hypothetical protein BXZ70DRAFT_174331 [Cristinia sonorae]